MPSFLSSGRGCFDRQTELNTESESSLGAVLDPDPSLPAPPDNGLTGSQFQGCRPGALEGRFKEVVQPVGFDAWSIVLDAENRRSLLDAGANRHRGCGRDRIADQEAQQRRRSPGVAVTRSTVSVRASWILAALSRLPVGDHLTDGLVEVERLQRDGLAAPVTVPFLDDAADRLAMLAEPGQLVSVLLRGFYFLDGHLEQDDIEEIVELMCQGTREDAQVGEHRDSSA